jgi:hypothetical protein
MAGAHTQQSRTRARVRTTSFSWLGHADSRARKGAPRFVQHTFVQPSASFRRCAMPTTLAPGATTCARIPARSYARHRRRRRQPTICWPSATDRWERQARSTVRAGSRAPSARHAVAASGLAALLPAGAASQRQRRDEKLRDGADEAARDAPGRPVADNQPETLPWPSRNPGSH